MDDCDDLGARRRRALYRATHRGSKEMDVVLGRFAERYLESMADDDVARLERLIDMPDPDLALSFYEGQSLGTAELDELVAELRRFHGLPAHR